MDETWSMSMGMPGIPRRRSMEEEVEAKAAGPNRRSVEALDAEDFADVFGGPPRSVLSRKFSGEFATPSSVTFYEEVFRPPELSCSSKRGGGRSLPAFRIPARGGGFYSDVFGSEEEEGRRSRERSRPNSKGKSKSNSSSVLSSEELSPLRRPTAGDDPALSSFASKLRPINVPCRWNSTTMRPEDQLRKQGMPSFQCNPPTYNNHFMENGCNDNARSSCFKVPRLVSSPETISLEPVSYRSIKVSADHLELNSPSSPVSSLCEEQEAMAPVGCNLTQEEMEGEEDEEVMSSYVIEISSNRKEGSCEAASIDEAIAWAKEKFQAHSFDRQHEKDHYSADKPEERPKTHESIGQQVEGHGRMQSPKMELEALDEDVRLWSAGKETNVRLLLSALHDILWPNSGWHAIPLTNLVDSSQVKKAYQKARLCLHPDKLQQRGATLPQKYVAEKAFSILQNEVASLRILHYGLPDASFTLLSE